MTAPPRTTAGKEPRGLLRFATRFDPEPSAASALRFRAILLAGVLLQLALFLAGHFPAARPLRGDELHYHRRATLLATGAELPPDDLWPPLQSHLLGAVYRASGGSRVPLELAQSLAFLGAALLFRRLAGRAGLAPAAADLAFALFLLDPQLAIWPFTLWPEAIHLALALGATELLLAGGAAALLAGGALLGLALLAKSVLVPFVPLFVLAAGLGAGAWRSRRAALFLAGVVAVAAPVLLARGLVHDRWRPGSSAALNLWIGLGDPADPSRTIAGRATSAWLASPIPPSERDRDFLAASRRLVAERGVLGTLRDQLAKQPRRLLERESFFTEILPGGRWRPGEESRPVDRRLRALAALPWALALLLAGVGLVEAPWRHRRRPLLFAAAVLAGQALLFLFLHATNRYRVPMLPPLLLFSGFGAASLASLPRGVGGWLRKGAGLAISALLLAAAFG